MTSLSIRQSLTRYSLLIAIAIASSIILGLLTSLLGLILGPILSGILSQNYDPHQLQIEKIFPFQLLPHNYLVTYVINMLSMERLPFFLLAIASFKAVLTFIIFIIWENIGERVATEFRKIVFSNFMSWRPELRESDTGSKLEEHLSSQITNNLRLTKQYIVRFYGGIPREALQTIFLIIALLTISSELFVYIVVFVIPVGLFIDRSAKAVKRRVRRALTDYSSLSSWIEQRFLGIETIKHFISEKTEVKNMDQQGRTLYKKFLRAAKIKSLTSPTTEVIGIIALALVIYFSTTSQTNTSPATLLSFFACLGLLSQSITKLSKYINARAEGKAAFLQIKHSFEHLNQQRLDHIFPPKSQSLEKKTTAIACKDLSYRYPESENLVLDTFNFDFSFNQFYAVFGHSGAGKSTLMKLLLNYFEPTSGKVAFHYPKSSKYPISYLPQNPIIVPGTLAENVTYPLPADQKDSILTALRKANCDFIFERFQQNLDYRLNESDAKLSGGQIQRLNLARIFYLNSEIILADECTSALDQNTEEIILKALKELSANGTCVIMIAHRPIVLDYADQVLLLDKGQLINVGSASELKEEVIETIKND